jgi:hypothetical protein
LVLAFSERTVGAMFPAILAGHRSGDVCRFGDDCIFNVIDAVLGAIDVSLSANDDTSSVIDVTSSASDNSLSAIFTILSEDGATSGAIYGSLNENDLTQTAIVETFFEITCAFRGNDVGY